MNSTSNEIVIQSQSITVNLSVAMTGLSVHTQRPYKRWITEYFEDVANLRVEVAQLNALEVAAYINVPLLKGWMGHLRSRDLSKQSLSQAKSAIVWLAGTLADLQYFGHDVPAALSRIRLPNAEVDRRHNVRLTTEQTREFLIAVSTLSKSRTINRRNIAIVMLMVLCGLRREEVTKIQWTDIYQDNGEWLLLVHGKRSKTRRVKLSAAVVNALNDWREVSTSPTQVFTQIRKSETAASANITLGDKTLWNVVREAALKCGIEGLAPHDLRRTFARGSYEAGASFELIRQSLGHSNLATTERYVMAQLEIKRAASDIWTDAVLGK